MSSKTKTTATKEEVRPALVPKLRFPEFRGAEDWDVEFLGGICQPQQWTTISSTDLVDEGYPVYGANGLIGYYSDFNHEFETVAVTCRGSTCGEVSLIPPKSYITGNSMCLDGIDAAQNSYHFLYQLLRHRGFDDVISGSAQPQIVGNAIRRLRIALPAKPEQQKIAECLSSVDELRAAQARKVDALKTHKKGLMQQLFPREGETQPRLRFPEFKNAGEWEPTTIGALGKFYYGKSAPKWSLADDAPTPCVRYGELYTKFGPEITETYSRTNIDPTTLRFSKGGEILIPRVGEKPEDFGKCCCYLPLKGIAIGEMISVLETKQHPLFYTYYFRCLYKQFAKVVEGQNVKNLYYAELEPLPIHRPSIPEQQRIAWCLSSLDALINAETQKLEVLKTHKKGLMQQLFPSPEEVEA